MSSASPPYQFVFKPGAFHLQKNLFPIDPRLLSRGLNLTLKPAADSKPPKADTGTSKTQPRLQIPSEFPQDALRAAKFYTEQGITVFPLIPPKAGDRTQNGKKPAIKGYKELQQGWADDKTLDRYWGGSKPYNIAGLVPQGMVVVDLDSKADQGQTARKFIEQNPQLRNALRVHTQGGVHLWLQCPDIPALTKADGKPLAAPLTQVMSDSLVAELMLPGMQITLPPSRRDTGHVYQWQDHGTPARLAWGQLVQIFGFTPARAEPQTFHQRLNDLQKQHKGDLRSLDVVKLFREIGRYKDIVKQTPPTHAVTCPFSEDHSTATDDSGSTSTVIFGATQRTAPGFHCLHAHCADRTLIDVIARAEQEHPGIIDKCCQRPWRPQIALPGEGRSQSEFAGEVALIASSTRKYFLYGTEVSMLRRHPSHPMRKTLGSLEARQAITALEEDISFGHWRLDESKNEVFITKSMSGETATVLLAADQLKEALPIVKRLLDTPVPLLNGENKITLPQIGYDPVHQTYLQPAAPSIEMLEVAEAKRFLLEDFLGDLTSGGFPWHDEQSKTNALARVLTPLCRGLMGWQKAPVFVMLANQPRLGKDTFAMTVQMLYTGEAGIGATLNSKEGDAEMRKRITALLRNGHPFIHFANMHGLVNFGSLEAATDASLLWTDRILGHSREATLPNEAEYSLSMNLGATLTRDLLARSVVIELYLAAEEPNNRAFKHANLLEWVKENRSKILGALLALIREWDRQGRPKGSVRFASFPKWAEVVGGIMEANDLGNPCKRQPHISSEIGDAETEDLRRLFEMANQAFGNAFVTKAKLYQLLSDSGEDAPFAHFNLTGEKESKADQTKFGKILLRYKDRELSGITLRIDDSDKCRKKLAFVRKGDGKSPLNPPRSPCLTQTLQTSQTAPIGPEGVRPSLQPGQEGACEQVTNPCQGELSATMPLQVCNVCEVPNEPPSYRVVSGKADTQQLLCLLDDPDVKVGLDLETFGEKADDALNPRRGNVRLISLAVGNQILLLDVVQTPEIVAEILGALKKCLLIGHNLAFDLAFLKRHYGFEARAVFCTMTASRVLHAGKNFDHDLGSVLQRELGINLAKELGSSDWSGSLTQAQLDYAAADVAHLADLRTALQRELDATKLTATAELEMECALLAVEMQSNGMPVESAGLQTLLIRAEADLATAQAKVEQLAGAKININSPGQIAKCLKSRGHTLTNTQEETLVALKDPLAHQIVLAKQACTQIKKCNELIGSIESDGRIHASFNPMQAKTGRFSTSKPNLQSIPRGPMRSCFRPRPGFKLVDADYSQIELRIAAAITDEEKMLKAFAEGTDLHTQTAALILGKSLSEITPEERQMAKAVNFGLLFGQKPAGLVKYAAASYGVTLTESDATQISRGFFKAYPKLAEWQKRQNHLASTATEVRTALGRKRTLPKGQDAWWSRYTALLNSPIQGAAADGMKLALCRLRKQLPTGCLIVNTVHDEILVECPEDEAERVCELVEQSMVEEMQHLFPTVKIVAEAKTISSWLEK